MTIARLRGGSSGRSAERFRFVEPIAHCGELGGVGRDLSQRSPILLVIESRNPGLVAIVDFLRRNMQEPLGLDEIASRLGIRRSGPIDATPPRSRWTTASLDEKRTRQAETDVPWTDDDRPLSALREGDDPADTTCRYPALKQSPRRFR